MTELSGWSTFYNLVGTAAGSLTGLQFVVVALVSDLPMSGDETNATNAFSTPTIFHFGVVLLLTATFSAPWKTLLGPAIVCGGVGLFGLVYTLIIGRRMGSQDVYAPVLEDWIFHAILPGIAYAVLTGTGCLAPGHTGRALFALAAALLVLLVVGIHNAWDNVTYLVLVKRRSRSQN